MPSHTPEPCPHIHGCTFYGDRAHRTASTEPCRCGHDTMGNCSPARLDVNAQIDAFRVRLLGCYNACAPLGASPSLADHYEDTEESGPAFIQVGSGTVKLTGADCHNARVALEGLGKEV